MFVTVTLFVQFEIFKPVVELCGVGGRLSFYLFSGTGALASGDGLDEMVSMEFERADHELCMSTSTTCTELNWIQALIN